MTLGHDLLPRRTDKGAMTVNPDHVNNRAEQREQRRQESAAKWNWREA